MLCSSSFLKVSVFTYPHYHFQNDAFSIRPTFETVFESLRFYQRFGRVSVNDKRKRFAGPMRFAKNKGLILIFRMISFFQFTEACGSHC